MGLLDRWANIAAGPTPPTPVDPGTRPRPLTAAGMRVNLKSPSLIHTRRHEWQTAAWDYRDEVPELRFAGDFVTNALGRLRVFPAENRPRGQEPVPLAHDAIPAEVTAAPQITEHTRQCAAAAIERLDLDRHGSSLLARMGENLEFAGECYLLGEPGDEGEQWTIRSVSEVQITQGGARLVEPGAGMVASRDLRAEQCELLRLWSPHPRYYDWPDAAVSALLGTLEGMVLLGRRGRAHDRSRISSGKALFVPDELSLSRAGTAEDVDEDGDPFLAGLTEAMLTPIRDESDPSAVVPLVIRGPGMMGDRPTADVIGTVDLHGEDPTNLDERYENLVQRFARGINLPPEIVKGIGEVNHWSGAVIDASMVKSHVEPRAERMVDALTAAYFRPALKAMGVPLEQRNRVCLWFDSSELVQNPNRDQAAKDAHAAGVISDAALARELGFTADDEPTDLERLRRAVDRERLSPASVPILVKLLAGQMPTDRDMNRILGEFTQSGQPRIIDAGRAAPTAPSGGRPPDTPGGVRTAPAPPSDGPGMAAAAGPGRYRVDEQACRKLAAIDRALTDRLVAHAEATIGRAVERAANRVRGRAQKDPLLAATFPKGCDPVAVCAAAGRKTAGDLTDDEVLDGAVDAFGRRFLREVAHAARQTAAVVAAMVGKQAAEQVTDGITGRAEGAWAWLRARLERHITRVLYGETSQEGGPDDVDPVPTSIVRGALTLVGGQAETSPGIDDDGHPVVAPGRVPEPQTGPATGQVVTDTIRSGGGETLGWVWGYYGIARKDPFTPHQRLDGHRFEGFDDPGLASGADAWLGPFYHPGDHGGCMCSVEMIWAVPDGPSSSTVRDELQLDETPAMRDTRLLAEDDDRAGRTGTTAQRDRDTAAELDRLRREHIHAREGAAS